MKNGDLKNVFKLLLVFYILLIFILFYQPFDQWADKGETSSYTGTFGEDSDYPRIPQSYTKLGSGGVELSDIATVSNGWIMTKDNVTGLIWEVKTDNKNDVYTWCDTNLATNGGDAGTCGKGTDTADFINAFNSENLGGFSDWRLPTIKELSTIVNSDADFPTINTTFFPNTVSSYYWSSTPYMRFSGFAWLVYLNHGIVIYCSKSDSYYVRAVRGVYSGPFYHLPIRYPACDGDG